MSDALPLPPRPDLEQYKKLAKDLQQACKSDDRDAIRIWAARWVEHIARLRNREISPAVQREIDFETERIEHRWHRLRETKERAARCTLADAQFFVARCHGFASWPKFAKHLNELARANSPVSKFEQAVEAIVNGDAAGLQQLLSENPELVRARSTRDHRSTLLHYVSANGVEDFRQKTPANIVEIAKLLLNAGADVSAESDAYAGRSTALGLTATSCHPEDAGVQIELMELLIDHGAMIDGPDGGTFSAGAEEMVSAVNGCLRNGRGQAAEFFASRGARLDLEGAAGVGRLDVLQTFFGEDGKLKASATTQQMRDGFAWACEFGRTEAVDFLLQRGMKVDERLKHDGQTGLHWAAYGGHPDTVKLLLTHGAPVEVVDETHGGTPLGWALYGWGGDRTGRYYEVVARLVQAGATLQLEWYQDDDDRRRALEKALSDPRMAAALRGETPR
jgi:hypothetical protein